MDARRKTRLFSATGAVLVLGVLAAANALSQFFFARLDLSAGRAYSISPGTKAVLKSLKDNLVVKVYYTKDLPPPYGLNERYLRDLLAEYKRAGGSRVQVEFQDPEGNDRAKREAVGSGVSPVRLSVMARDKFELKEAFMGLALLYEGKLETIPVVQNPDDFEYDLTRRIKKLSDPTIRTVGFVAGHGEKGPGDPALRDIYRLVEQQMDALDVSLDKPLPAKIDALWIMGPDKPYKPHELERLKAWVNSGRSLGIALDRRSVELRTFTTAKQETGLEPLLAAWGGQIRDALVVDAQAERIQLQSQQGMFVMMNVIEYPFIPVATRFNPDHPATRGLDAVSLPFTHAVSFKDGAPLKFTSLLDSSAQSWLFTDLKVSPYDPLKGVENLERGPFSLAGVLEGDFSKVAPTTFTARMGDAPGLTGPGRVVLLGTSRLIHPGLTIKPSNISMMLNLLEWSLQDLALLSIRSKGLTYRYLRPLPDAGRLAVKYGLILVPPFGLLVIGFWVYRRQKARMADLAAAFAAEDPEKSEAPPIHG